LPCIHSNSVRKGALYLQQLYALQIVKSSVVKIALQQNPSEGAVRQTSPSISFEK